MVKMLEIFGHELNKLKLELATFPPSSTVQFSSVQYGTLELSLLYACFSTGCIITSRKCSLTARYDSTLISSNNDTAYSFNEVNETIEI